jgi:hypothetical protein
VDVVKVATPELRLAEPSVVDPSANVTVPVAEEGLTVAVNVTAWPKAEGFSEEVSVVVLGVLPPPVPVAPNKMLTLLLLLLATAKSTLPSPLKSARATDTGPVPTA